MRVGIDFGTTHTVVAAVDRGNYPVVSFDGVDAWPSIIAANAAGELRFGADAAAVRHDPGWSVLRSFKRLLNDAGPQTQVNLAGRDYRLADLLTGFLAQLKTDLQRHSNADLASGEPIEAAISVPANASSAQRLLTLDAYVAAGFRVVALLNEPSAASLEYAHRYRSTITTKREHVLIYDLGGGTFDASLLKMTGHANEVVVSEGIQRLGGDDFDEAIVELVLAGAGRPVVDAATRDLLAEECATRKEAVGPQTRRFLVDLSPSIVPRSPAPSTTSTRCVRRWSTARWSCSTGSCATRRARPQGRGPLGGGGHLRRRGRGRFPAGVPDAAQHLRRQAGQALAAPLRRHGHRPCRLPRQGIGFRAVRTLFEKLRRLPGGGGRRRGRVRPDRVQGRLASRRRPIPAGGEAQISGGAQHRALPVRGVQPPGQRAAGRRRHAVRPGAVSVRPCPARPGRPRASAGRPLGGGADGPDVEERYVIAPSGAVEVTLTTHPAGFERTFRLERCGSAS